MFGKSTIVAASFFAMQALAVPLLAAEEQSARVTDPCELKHVEGIAQNAALMDDLSYAYDHSSAGWAGNDGSVDIHIAFDRSGKIAKILSIQSSLPVFTDMVIDHFLNIHADVLGGDPSCAQFTYVLKVDFRMQSYADESIGVSAYKIDQNSKGDSLLPDDYRFDVAPKLINATPLLFPLESALAGEGGSATVIMDIGPDGDVASAVISSASKPEFGHALKAMVEGWHFTAPQRANKPARALIRYPLSFYETREREMERNDGALSKSAYKALQILRNDPDSIVAAGSLDTPLKLLYQAPYLYPSDVAPQATGSHVEVEFLVDGAGHVQWPKLVHGVQADLDWAALAAVSQWRFFPPTKDGKPVVTRMKAAFNVGAEEK